MEKTALLIINAQQEYFAPVGKMVLPDGPVTTSNALTSNNANTQA